MSKSPKIKVPSPPPPTQEETDINKLSSLLLQQQASEEFDIIRDDDGNIVDIKRKPLTPEEIEAQEFERDLIARAREQLLGQPSEETRELVGKTFESTRTRGTDELQRFAIQQAGSRGLRLSDSPIGETSLRAKADLEAQLASAEAGALLNVGERERIFAQSLREFQNQLEQQKFVNQLNLAGRAGQFGAQQGATRASLFRPQVIGGGGSVLGGIAGGLSSAGNFMQGAAALAAFLPKSSRKFKHAIVSVTEEESGKMLEKALETPIYKWRYNAFPDKEHIGPMTEESPTEIVDGDMLDVVGYLGFLLGCVKALTRKLQVLEAENG
jgi:hypothetical protein